MDDYLKLLESAKLLTGSHDIDVIIEAAKKIKEFKDGETTPPHRSHHDILEFIDDCRVSHPVKGAVPLLCMDFQKDVLVNLNEGINLVNVAPQMGMNTTLAIYSLFKAVSKPNQTVLLMSNTLNSAMELLDRIRYTITKGKALLPSIVVWTKHCIEFNNGSKIMIRAVTPNALRDVSPNLIYIHNATGVSHRTFEQFWPTIFEFDDGEPSPQIILQFNGGYSDGPVARLWQKSRENGDAQTFHIPWSEHPERDQAWANSIRTMVGMETFIREYECSILSREG